MTLKEFSSLPFGIVGEVEIMIENHDAQGGERYTYVEFPSLEYAVHYYGDWQVFQIFGTYIQKITIVCVERSKSDDRQLQANRP